MASSVTLYNVECMDCGQVFTPAGHSPLWWQAKQRADRGFLDALRIRWKSCGCIQEVENPNAPFRVFGYDDLCEDFNIPCNSFVAAIKSFRKLRPMSVVFITGVSDVVAHRLQYGL